MTKDQVKPTLIIDQREQAPLTFTRFQSIRGTLLTGDYSIAGLEELFSIERKTVADLVGCCVDENRNRFERELHRLRGFRFKRLLIVGSEQEILAGRYYSAIKPQAVLATLGAFEARYDLAVVYKATPEDAARQIERWAYWFSREVIQAAASLQKANGRAEAVERVARLLAKKEEGGRS
jgi:ERCC4-type nuclease